MQRAWENFGEKRLGDLERLLRVAVTHSLNGVVVTDATLPDNPIVYVNRAFERITGYPAKEAVGNNCRFLQNPQSGDRDQSVLDALRGALRESRAWTGVLRNRRKDGKPFWNELHLAPVRDERGKVTHYVGIQNDVTRRVEAEREQARVSAEYERIVRMLPNVVFRWSRDADGTMRLAYCEGALAERFGVTTGLAFGKTLGELFPPEFLRTVEPAFCRAFSGETVEFSSRIGDRTFGNVAMPYPGTGGERNGSKSHEPEIVGYVVEVTERDRAEEALRKSEERFEVAIRGSNDGIWDWDLRTGEVYFSARWKEMLGFRDHEIENSFEGWKSRIHPEDLEPTLIALEEYLGGQRAHYELEHRLLHRDGSYRWILTRGASLRGEGGRPYRMSGSHTDVTERKALEERLRRQALYDALTGLPNRAMFTERLENAFLKAERGGCFAVLFVDLDGFKAVNDSFGHEAGDRLLVEVAGRLKGCVGAADTVARLGGDEFVVLIEDVDSPNDANIVASRISERLGQPVSVEHGEVCVTASTGVVLSDGEAHKPRDLMRNADLAMYRAKRLGGNRHSMFDPPDGNPGEMSTTVTEDHRRSGRDPTSDDSSEEPGWAESGIAASVKSVKRTGEQRL